MTSRTLIILRHAKAEVPGDLIDFDRSLTERGESDADAAGAWLADARLHPGLVLCSPARRTRQTWQFASIALAQGNNGHTAPEVHYEESLYLGGRTEVFDLLRAVPGDVRTVLLVGHNPTVSEVSALLLPDDQFQGGAGLQGGAGFQRGAVEMKTSGIAVHSSDEPWSAAQPGAMRLTRRHTARG